MAVRAEAAIWIRRRARNWVDDEGAAPEDNDVKQSRAHWDDYQPIRGGNVSRSRFLVLTQAALLRPDHSMASYQSHVATHDIAGIDGFTRCN